MQEFFEQVDSFIYSGPMIIVQIMAGVISFGLLIFYIQLIRKTGLFRLRYVQFKEGITKTPAPVGKIFKRWREVKRKINSDDETQWKFAIVEADSILDDTLFSLGYLGENMEERLNNIKPGQFALLDDAQRLHKVRNFIAHNPSYHIKHDIALRAIKTYHNIFKELGVLREVNKKEKS